MLERGAVTLPYVQIVEAHSSAGKHHATVVRDDAVVVEGVALRRHVVPIETQDTRQVRIEREHVQQARARPLERGGAALVGVLQTVQPLRIRPDDVVDNLVELVAKSIGVFRALVGGQSRRKSRFSLGLIVRRMRMWRAPIRVSDRQVDRRAAVQRNLRPEEVSAFFEQDEAHTAHDHVPASQHDVVDAIRE